METVTRIRRTPSTELGEIPLARPGERALRDRLLETLPFALTGAPAADVYKIVGFVPVLQPQGQQIRTFPQRANFNRPNSP